MNEKLNTFPFIFSRIVIFICGAISLLFFPAMHYIMAILLAFIFTLFVIVVSYLEYRDWKSPMLYLPFFLFLYNTVFPIYYYLGGDRLMNITPDAVSGAYLIFYIFLLGVAFGYVLTPFMESRNSTISREKYISVQIGKIETTLTLIIFLILYCFSFVQYSSVSHMGKEERMLTGVVSFSVFFGGVYFPLLYLLINTYLKKNKIDFKKIFLVVIFGAFGYLFFGERDQLILPLATSLVVYGYFRRISFGKIILIGSGLIVCLFLLGLFRSFVESGISREISSFVLILQENEFISAGRNLALVLSSDHSLLFGKTFLGDLFSPMFIDLFPSGLRWFSDNYIQNKGFSLVAESYINFGYLGTFIVGAFFSFTLNQIYRLSFNSNIMTILYIILMFAAMYSLRSDFASVISAVFRKFMIPIILAIIIRILLKSTFSLKITCGNNN